MAGAGGGGAGAGAGAAMAMANHANAMGMPNAHQAPPQGSHIPGGSTALPPNAAALGADLVAKDQHALSQKQARNVAHLPLVAVDLYGSEPHVAMFPPKQSTNNGDGPTPPPQLVGKMKPDVYFKGNDEQAHKTLRKYLTKSKPYTALVQDALTVSDNKDAVCMERPQNWLGLRRASDAAKYLQKAFGTGDDSHAIAEEQSLEVGVTIDNSTLDGSEPLGDDFDRVVFKTRVHPKKKALAVLPEEGVEILVHQAQYHVSKKIKADKDDEEIMDYPCAISVPAWQCNDAAIESLMDAMGGSGVVFQRSICAAVGALRPGPQDKPNALLTAINDVRTTRMKEFQITKAKDPGAVMVDEVTLFFFGMAHDGVECTALQVGTLQPEKTDCLFGEIKVLSNVSYQAEDPAAVLEKCMTELRDNLNAASMADVELPPAIAVYGTKPQQSTIKEKFEALVKSGKLNEWKDIPVVTTTTDCVAMGTAVLGGVSHGRLRSIQQLSGKKPKAILAIRVANVAPVAVGVRINYHGDSKKGWLPVKTIFDFDRRVPAGPYTIDFRASECAVHRELGSDLSDEEFLKAAKANEGSKKIPKREEAARNLRVQILQKWSRDGDWKKVGDVKKALVVLNKDEEEIPVEHVALELSLAPSGIITAGLQGEG